MNLWVSPFHAKAIEVRFFQPPFHHEGATSPGKQLSFVCCCVVDAETPKWLMPAAIFLHRRPALVISLQFNIANPANGAMKVIDIDDEKKLATFYERRIGHEVEGDVLGDDFKGFVFRCVLAWGQEAG